MPKKEFPTQWMKYLVFGDLDENEAVVIRDTITENSRWSILHKVIFKTGDRFYSCTYNIGATEYQDERPFDNEGPMVECTEVAPVQVTTTEYRPVD